MITVDDIEVLQQQRHYQRRDSALYWLGYHGFIIHDGLIYCANGQCNWLNVGAIEYLLRDHGFVFCSGSPVWFSPELDPVSAFQAWFGLPQT